MLRTAPHRISQAHATRDLNSHSGDPPFVSRPRDLPLACADVKEAMHAHDRLPCHAIAPRERRTPPCIMHLCASSSRCLTGRSDFPEHSRGVRVILHAILLTHSQRGAQGRHRTCPTGSAVSVSTTQQPRLLFAASSVRIGPAAHVDRESAHTGDGRRSASFLA
jgi:hypothetical protein